MGIRQLLNNPLQFLMDAAYTLPAILIALMLHEVAHGFVAYRLGDPTAKQMGRLSLNPLRHLDPVGFFMMMFVGIGWAKPVPVNPRHFKHPRRDDILVSMAGITVNFILFVLALAGAFTVAFYASGRVAEEVMQFLFYFAQVNAVLGVFNLLPIPPLDGYHLFSGLIPGAAPYASRQASQAGMAVLMVLSFSGLLSKGLSFVVSGMYSVVGAALLRFFV